MFVDVTPASSYQIGRLQAELEELKAKLRVYEEVVDLSPAVLSEMRNHGMTVKKRFEADSAAIQLLEGKKPKAKTSKEESIFLPEWAEHEVGFPTFMLKSNLWSAGKTKDIALRANEPLLVLDKTAMLFVTGPQLYVKDRNTLSVCLDICKEFPVLSEKSNTYAYVSVFKFIEKTGIAYGQRVHQSLVDSLYRLEQARIVGDVGANHIDTNFIEVGFKRSEARFGTKDWCSVTEYAALAPTQRSARDLVGFRVPFRFAELYQTQSYSCIPLSITHSHGFRGYLAGLLSTLIVPTPIALTKLKAISGMATSTGEFKRSLISSLEELKDNAFGNAQVDDYAISRKGTHVTIFLKEWQMSPRKKLTAINKMEAEANKPGFIKAAIYSH